MENLAYRTVEVALKKRRLVKENEKYSPFEMLEGIPGIPWTP